MVKSPIDEAIEVFGRWLILNDPTPLYAVFGAVAANLLEGDPVWLGLIAPPSSAKTEISTRCQRCQRCTGLIAIARELSVRHIEVFGDLEFISLEALVPRSPRTRDRRH
jgi:hypothetical protein